MIFFIAADDFTKKRMNSISKNLFCIRPRMPWFLAQPLSRSARFLGFRVAPYPAMRHIPLESGRSPPRIRRGATTGTQRNARAHSHRRSTPSHQGHHRQHSRNRAETGNQKPTALEDKPTIRRHKGTNFTQSIKTSY